MIDQYVAFNAQRDKPYGIPAVSMSPALRPKSCSAL